MTYRNDFSLPAELLEQVQEQGLDVLPELIRIVLNAAMQAERSEHLQAAPYQHNEDRRGYANGYKPKTMRTRVGDITFAVPQVREGGFDPQGYSHHRTVVRREHLVFHSQPGGCPVGRRTGEVA